MSATPYLVPPISLPASADLSASQFCFVNLNASGQLALPSAGGRVVGVLETKPDAQGKVGSVRTLGPARVLAAGSFDPGASLKADAAGKAVLASAGDILAGSAIAVALEAGASGKMASIHLLTASAGAAVLSVGGDEVVAAAGAVSIYTAATYLEIDGTKAYTLADGFLGGQEKTIECTAVSGTPLGTLTIASPLSGEPAAHVFTAVGQCLVLRWDADAGVWRVADKKRAGTQIVTVGTSVLTGYDMASTYALDIDGTVTSDQATEAIPDGQVAGEAISVVPGTLENTPDGDINITGKNLDGVAIVSMDTMDSATAHNAHFRWDGAAWQVTSFAGVTLETT